MEEKKNGLSDWVSEMTGGGEVTDWVTR